MCYVLVNFNSTIDQDIERVKILDELGLDPFVMIYQRESALPLYKQLGRWCNRPQIRHSCTFDEYQKMTPTFNNTVK